MGAVNSAKTSVAKLSEARSSSERVSGSYYSKSERVSEQSGSESREGSKESRQYKESFKGNQSIGLVEVNEALGFCEELVAESFLVEYNALKGSELCISFNKEARMIPNEHNLDERIKGISRCLEFLSFFEQFELTKALKETGRSSNRGKSEENEGFFMRKSEGEEAFYAGNHKTLLSMKKKEMVLVKKDSDSPYFGVQNEMDEVNSLDFLEESKESQRMKNNQKYSEKSVDLEESQNFEEDGSWIQNRKEQNGLASSRKNQQRISQSSTSQQKNPSKNGQFEFGSLVNQKPKKHEDFWEKEEASLQYNEENYNPGLVLSEDSQEISLNEGELATRKTDRFTFQPKQKETTEILKENHCFDKNLLKKTNEEKYKELEKSLLSLVSSKKSQNSFTKNSNDKEAQLNERLQLEINDPSEETNAQTLRVKENKGETRKKDSQFDKSSGKEAIQAGHIKGQANLKGKEELTGANKATKKQPIFSPNYSVIINETSASQHHFNNEIDPFKPPFLSSDLSRTSEDYEDPSNKTSNASLNSFRSGETSSMNQFAPKTKNLVRKPIESKKMIEAQKYSKSKLHEFEKAPKKPKSPNFSFIKHGRGLVNQSSEIKKEETSSLLSSKRTNRVGNQPPAKTERSKTPSKSGSEIREKSPLDSQRSQQQIKWEPPNQKETTSKTSQSNQRKMDERPASKRTIGADEQFVQEAIGDFEKSEWLLKSIRKDVDRLSKKMKQSIPNQDELN